MLVSSYTLCKNNDDTIRSTLKYAVDSFDDIVIVDSGSTDNTINIIKEFAQEHSKINFIEHEIEDKDLVNQFNFALRQCKGDWLIRLDSDEIYSFSDWNLFLLQLDRLTWQLHFHTYHLQKDSFHYNNKLFGVYWKRVWRNNKGIFFRRDEKGGEDYTSGPLNVSIIEDRYVINFGHLKNKDKLIQKFRDFELLKYPHDWKFDKRYDGSEECLFNRNKEWDLDIKELPDNIKNWVIKYE